MAKREIEIMTAQAESVQPLTKRPRVDSEDVKTLKTSPSSEQSLMKLLPEVAAASLVHVSDDDDASSCSSEDSNTEFPKKSLLPHPSQLVAISVKLTNAQRVAGRINTSENYCRSGKPLSCPPILLSRRLQARLPPLKKIDSTLV